MIMAKIYLIPDKDSTYTSCISDDKPSSDAIFLTDEGKYPTVAWHRRHDLNMCSILMTETVIDRYGLLEYLNFLGTCRHAIVELWNYNIDENASDELISLFDTCYKRKAELISQAMFDACEGIDDDEDVGRYDIVNEPNENLPF